MWMDQEREESMCGPSSLYEVTLSMICDEILRYKSIANTSVSIELRR